MSRGYKWNKEFGGNSECLENDVEDVIPTPRRVKTIAKASMKELPDVKATWKSFLPTLSTEDVRRYRVPHYEVVILELEEAGYADAAQCMKTLFGLDEEMRTKAGPGAIIWTYPRLKDHVYFVERLKIGLVKANQAMLEEQRVAQVAALLQIALFFQENSSKWWWLAEQFFRSALNVSETVEDDDSQTITIVRYLYGRFLLNEMKDVNGSTKILDEARESSEGKLWNASKILGTRQDSLFRECSTLLYRALLSLAKKSEDNDADLAVEACQKALRHAMDSDHDEYITDATCELGRSYLRANQPKLALQNFVKYLNLSRKILDYEGICSAHMELAFAYKELGDLTNTMEHLELFRETASRFQLPYRLAQAHYHIGEHLLCRNSPAQATSHLEFAFRLYNGMGETVEVHQARCIAAVSKGQEVVDQFIKQILRCGRYDKTATLKLCEWKNSRAPFWKMEDDERESCEENAGDSDEIHKSIRSESLQSYSDHTTTTTHSGIIKLQSPESNASHVSGDVAPIETTEDHT